MNVRMPDGTVITNVPDDITRAELVSKYQNHIRASQQPELPKTADSNLGGTLQLGIPFTDKRYDTGISLPSSVEAGLVGAGKSTMDLINGVRQILPGSNDKLDAQVQADEAAYKPLAALHPVATTVGEMAPYLTATSIPAMVGMAATAYGTPEQRAERAALAYGGAKVGQTIGKFFGRQAMDPAGSLAQEFADYSAAQGGNKFGIPLRLAQVTDSKPVQIADAVLQNLPISSGVMNKAKDASFKGFNRAVGQTFGEDATQLTPEVLGAAKGRLGQVFNDVSARNSLKFEEPLFNDLLRVSERANTELVPEQANLVKSLSNKIVSDFGPDGKMPGTLYKAYDSQLGKLAKQYTGTLSDVFGDMRTALRNAMDSGISEADKGAWAAARRQYLNLQTVANAVKNSPEGYVSPSRLLQAVNTAQRNAKFGSGNDLAELAQWAKGIMPDKIPTSGTAERALYQRLISNPVTTIGTLGGAAYGADKAGVNPAEALSGALLTYGLARGMASPPSLLAQNLLTRGGGLLGIAYGR